MAANKWMLALGAVVLSGAWACAIDGETSDGSSAAALTEADPEEQSPPPSAKAPVKSTVGGSTTASPNGNNLGSPGAPTDLSAARVQCVDLLNQYRATLGLPALARVAKAESCLDGEAQSDGESGTAHGAFPKCGERAQNECPGWPGDIGSVITGCLQKMWEEGPGGGHYDNMVSTQYDRAACGIYQLPSGEYWVVQNFR